MCKEGDCRTAPATSGLLNIKSYCDDIKKEEKKKKNIVNRILSIWLGTQFNQRYRHIEDRNFLAQQYPYDHGLQELITTPIKVHS